MTDPTPELKVRRTGHPEDVRQYLVSVAKGWHEAAGRRHRKQGRDGLSFRIVRDRLGGGIPGPRAAASPIRAGPA
jgi:hypothetical protein